MSDILNDIETDPAAEAMGDVVALDISEIGDDDVETVVALWHSCGLTRPWNDPHADITLARRSAGTTVLVGRCDSAVVATAMTGYDGHRGWVYYVAVDPERRGKGFGRAIMAAAEDWLRTRGIAKLMLLVRPDNTKVQAFYETLGYDEQERIVYAKWLDGREATP
jgi:ribosomal protein S18 acetylase RimI-like enzyme